ncbi:MAG: GerAB/ArcD/ProY family transporter [Thermoanaerobacteraceae bacterium]
MIDNNDKVTANQVSILVFNTIVGAGILSLPSDVSKEAGPNGILAVILAGFLSLFFARFILYISSLLPKETFVEYSSKLITKPISVFVSIVFSFYLLLFVSFDARIFGEVLKIYLLPTTPIEIIILTMLFTSAYLVRYGIEPIVRMSEILFPFIVLPLMIVFFPAINEIDMANFLPLLKVEPIKFLKGVLVTTYSFVGFEILYMVYPYVKNKEKLKKGINYSIAFVTFLYVYIVFFTVGIFGHKETGEQLWPLLMAIKSINYPIFFVENIEGIMMGIWTFTIFTSIFSFYYFAVLTTAKLIKVKEHSYLVIPMIPIMFLIAIIPDSIASVYKYTGLASSYLSIFFIVVLPVILFLSIKIKKGDKSDNEKA